MARTMVRWNMRDSLALEPVSQIHCEHLFAEIEQSRESLSKWLSWVSLVQTHSHFHQLIKHYQEKASLTGAETWTILLHGMPVGILGLNEIHQSHNLGSIGYWLGSRYRGQGIMTKCVAHIIGYCFLDLRLDQLDILCGADNLDSQRVPRRLGFSCQEILPEGQCIHGVPIDLLRFSLTADHWAATHLR